MEAGQIRRDDPDLTAFFLWSRVHGIVTLMMACDFRESLPLPKDEAAFVLSYAQQRGMIMTHHAGALEGFGRNAPPGTCVYSESYAEAVRARARNL